MVLEHAGKVARVAEALRGRQAGRPVSLRKRAPPHQVPKAGHLRRSDEKVDVSDLDAILTIDPVRRICVAEPGVTFVDLVRATLRHGLVPMVVPELKTITVGGAVAGCSIESSSFKVGGFHDTCLEYEVITAKGDVVTCRPEGPDRLLFEMMHGSFGTLGVLSKLTFSLAPALPFVRVDYETYGTLDAYQAAILRRVRRQDVDFMDGILHARDRLVLSLGRFVDSARYAHRYGGLRPYYRSTARRTRDYLATEDYFFRYDHGVTHTSLLGSTQLLRLAERAPWLLRKKRPTMTLDVFVPFSRVPDFLGWYERTIGHFPLWCVPYRPRHLYEWISDELRARIDDDLFLDLAIYGLRPPKGTDYHAAIEQKLIEIGGIKTLIDQNRYSERDFWRVWNRDAYRAVKARTDPDNVFRDLYEKTCLAAMGRVSQSASPTR